MSGIELIGLAASILQIADLGWKSSYKLYAFSKRVHDAGRAIELVSQDIAATGAILKQLGEEVRKDEETTPASRLGTHGLVVAASKLVDECQTLFREIDQGITGEEGSKVILGFKQKLKWSYLGPRVDLLRTNLERLKSSLALMLNVLIYAEQQRSRQGAAVLKEQQELVASLAEQKSDSEKRIEELQKRIEAPGPRAQTTSDTGTPSPFHSLAESRVQAPRTAMDAAGTMTSLGATMSAVQISSFPSADKSAPPAPPWSPAVPVRARVTNAADQSVRHETSEDARHPLHLDHYRLLIESLLEEVNSSKYALDHGLRYRLHDGVLELHWREWQALRASYGDEMLQTILSPSPVLARHWYEMATKPAAQNPPKTESRGRSYTRNSRREISRPRREPLTSATVASPNPPGVGEAYPSQPEFAGYPTEQNFNLDFSSLENDDVLENFDFDAFLDTSNRYAYHSDSAMLSMGDLGATEPMLDSNATATPLKRKTDDVQKYPRDRWGPERRETDTREERYGPGNNASRVRGDGIRGYRTLEPEAEDVEDITALRDETKFGKQQDDPSTRNARRLAMQAEETGRNTLARLGAQAEQLHNTDENLHRQRPQTDAAVNKPREPKRLDKSMFAAYANNAPSSAQSRAPRLRIVKGGEDGTVPAGQNLAAGRVRYQFELDRERDETQAEEIDANSDELQGAAKRLNSLAFSRATVEAPRPPAMLRLKIGRLEDDMPFSDDPAAAIADQFLREWTTVEPMTNNNAKRLKRIR
ncbi:uncharacterized protein PV07_01315 [Cladophialophora immunda]|uniref:Azaphilone pigments biosynthesis cluster protein L N-terminal domain-containing protein n=1 Tax=Cladophialophora immunda TaxID=569365 RepID=A0A0D2CTR8_9EURO|nr:uncharacterized protein PV07_01315 [Cladophialophora immunda]KIW34538.1 hypothetical protein PV07_01315 [Cladophialophora immunda]